MIVFQEEIFLVHELNLIFNFKISDVRMGLHKDDTRKYIAFYIYMYKYIVYDKLFQND